MVPATYYKGCDAARKVLYDNLQKLIDEGAFTGKKIFMFGANKIASMIISFLEHNNIKMTGIVDNDRKSTGLRLMDLTIELPEELLKYGKDIIVLIASSWQNEMIKQLEDMGYSTDENIIKVIDLPLVLSDYSFVERTGYIEMKKEDIKKHQLEMLKFLRDLCTQNNINYYLGYGTLLGAVRHRGFIPWDDDVDVYVKDEDVDKLADLVNATERYQLITCKNCKGFFDNVFMMVDKETVMDINNFPLQATTGLNIDIFPLYGLPDNETELKEYAEKIKLLEMEKWNCLYDEEECHKAAMMMCEYLENYKYKDSEEVGVFYGSYFTKNHFKKEWFEEKEYLEFENEVFCVPKGYKDVLSRMYGDYMTPPPPEKREAKHYYNVYYSKSK